MLYWIIIIIVSASYIFIYCILNINSLPLNPECSSNWNKDQCAFKNKSCPMIYSRIICVPAPTMFFCEAEEDE